MFAWIAGRELTGRAVGAGFKMNIAKTALSAFRDDGALAMLGEIDDEFARFLVADDRAHGYAQLDVVAAFSVAIGAAAIFTVLGAVNAGVAIVDQGVDIAIGDGVNATAAAAVAAIRPAERDELLAPHTGGTVATVTGEDFYGCFVKKLHLMLSMLVEAIPMRLPGHALPRCNIHAAPGATHCNLHG